MLNRITQLLSVFVSGLRCTTGASLLGRIASGAGPAQEIPLGSGLAFSAGALTVTGKAASSHTHPYTEITGLMLEGTPTMEGVVASVTLDPTGSNNSVKISAPGAGTAGNLLTGAIVIDSVSDRTQLTIAQADYAITITSGDKRRMIVTGTLTDGTDPVVFPSLDWVEGDDGWGNGGADYQLLRTLDPFGDPVDPDTYSLTSSNGPTRNWTAPYTPGGFPDGLTFTPVSPATGTPTVTAAPATAAQVIAFGNDNRDEFYENGSGSDGSGAIAAVSTTSFTGGAGPTAATSLFMIDSDYLYSWTGSAASPTWKKSERASL
jgi:hypothetical protein